MSWLFEDATPVLTVSALFEVVLIFALFRSGEKKLLLIILGVAVACGIGVVIEAVVETDRERIEQFLEKTRQAVLTNDLQQVLPTIAPYSPALQSKAERYLGQFTVLKIKITEGPRITMHHGSTAISSSLDFIARFELDRRAGPIVHRTVLVRIAARLKETPEGWRWTEAQLEPYP